MAFDSVFRFRQSVDPGAVGPGVYWVDMASTPYALKIRNDANSGWVELGSSTGGGGGAIDTVSDSDSVALVLAGTDLSATIIDAYIDDLLADDFAAKSDVGHIHDDRYYTETETDTFLSGKASSSSLSTHIADTANPHAVTKTQVGLGSVDNTSDAAKPISTATQTALDLKASSSSLSTHIADTANPHAVTKTQVGLSNADNTSDAAKPISTATQTALDLKQALDPDLTTIAGLTATTDNFMVAASSAWASRTPAQAKTSLGLVKGDVGLGNVDNTSDASKPVSTATQTALDGKQPLDADLTTIAGLTATTDNFMVSASSAWASRTPAQAKTSLALVKADVGLGSVDNTSDAGKPVSTAQQTALDGKQPLDADLTAIAGLTATTDNFIVSVASAWASRTPTQVKTTLALNNVDNTSDAAKPVSTATQTALDLKQPLDSDLTAIAGLTATTDNFIVSVASAWASRTPTQVKTTLALNNVDNTSDAAKPVSTATQTALNLKADSSSLSTHIADTANPHAVTKTQVSLGNVTNDAQIKSADFPSASVDNEVVLFSGITGKILKRSSASGIPLLTSGVQSIAVAGTDYAAGVHTHTAANVTDFTEAAQDAVLTSGIVAGKNIDAVTYNDGSNSLTIDAKMFPGYVQTTRLFILNNIYPIDATNTIALVANRLYYIPFYVPASQSVNGAVFEIMTAVSGGVRVGVYSADQDSFLPITRLARSTTTTQSTIGVKTQTFSTVPTLPSHQWHFAALCSTTAMSIRGASGQYKIPSLRGGATAAMTSHFLLAFEDLIAGWTDLPLTATPGSGPANTYFYVGVQQG